MVELAGVAPSVERSAREVRALTAAGTIGIDEPGDDPWRRLRALAGDEEGTVVRLGVLPSALAETLEAVRAADCLAWAFPATGAVLGHAEAGLQPDAVVALRALAKRHGGFLQIDAASAELRRRVDPFDAEELTLVRSLKQQFDPRHVINRGRWAEGL